MLKVSGFIWDSVIDRYWTPYLSNSEYRIIRFIYQRTIKFNKEWEVIPIRHFIHGVYSKNELIQAGVGLKERWIRNTLKALIQRKFVFKIELGTGLANGYMLNIDPEIGKNPGTPMQGGYALECRGTPALECTPNNIGSNRMKVTSGTKGSGVKKMLEGAAEKTRCKRMQRESKGNITSFVLIWERCVKEYYAEHTFLSWRKKEVAIAKGVLKRLENNFDLKDFVEYSIEHWGNILVKFNAKPEIPNIGFFSKFLEVFSESYTKFNTTGVLPHTLNPERRSASLTSGERMELDALRKRFKTEAKPVVKRKPRRRLRVNMDSKPKDVDLPDWED